MDNVFNTEKKLPNIVTMLRVPISVVSLKLLKPCLLKDAFEWFIDHH
jgi:hypothetical protein